MTRWIVISVIAAIALFDLGLALADPKEPRATAAAATPGPAPQKLAVQPVDVTVRLAAGVVAPLHPTPTPPPKKTPKRSATPAATVVQQVRRVSTPVATTQPVAPAPSVQRPVATQAPKPAPTPRTPSYVGSEFDDSG